MIERTPVLDHGYVQLVEAWGSDERIVEAARMSTAKGFLGWGPESTWRCPQCNLTMTSPRNERDPPLRHVANKSMSVVLIEHSVPKPIDDDVHVMEYVSGHNGDERLLKYLYDHKHMTPFEMAGMTVEVQAPIFVFREWHRHRTQSYNELSARYTPLPDLNYVPSVERIMMTGGANKQAQGHAGTLPLTDSAAALFTQQLIAAYYTVQQAYESALGLGIPKELARLPIPVGRYSRMRASANLRNWLQFLTLRMAPEAQWEIRQYANVVGDLIAEAFPRTWQLFNVTGPTIEREMMGESI